MLYASGAFGSFGAISFFSLIDPSSVSETEDVLGTALPDAGILLEGIDFGNGGVYGLGYLDSQLYFFDPVSQNWSTIGDTGISWLHAGLAFDPLLNRLYAKSSGDTLLYSIDPISAETSAIGDTGIFQYGGLAFVLTPEPSAGLLIAFGLLTISAARTRSRRD